MRDYSNQKEEIATIKERTLKLSLSDADIVRISERAASVGLTVSELLESFIGDLVDGTYSNGSDERMLANEWFERCGFSFEPERTFLVYLIEWGNLQTILDTLDYIAECEGDLQDATEDEERKAIQEEIESQRKEIEDYYSQYSDEVKNPQTKEDALESVGAYKDRLETLERG